MNERTCSVPACGKPPRNRTAELCGMHYHRLYRHGDLEANGNAIRLREKVGSGYRSAYVPGHPLASKHGKVYEHRLVLFAALGPGEHPCHWCGAQVTWDEVKTPRALQVDHLDGDGFNNDLSNLVPSCPSCNTARAQHHRSDVLRALGYWSKNDTIATLTSRSRRQRVEGAWTEPTPMHCALCGHEMQGRKRTLCDAVCQAEHNARKARERWCRNNGLPPLGMDAPSKAWATGQRRPTAA